MTIRSIEPNKASHRPAMVGVAVVLMLLAVGCSGDTGAAEHSDSGAARGVDRELIDAAWANDVPAARELIAAGADVNFQDDTQQGAYLIATSEGYPELLELTLENGADVASLDSYNGTGLIRAAERGHVGIVARLVETEIDVNHINNLGWTALHEAIILGDGSDRYVQTVELLLDHGADPSLATGRGEAPLTMAEDRGQTAVAALLQAALNNQ